MYVTADRLRRRLGSLASGLRRPVTAVSNSPCGRATWVLLALVLPLLGLPFASASAAGERWQRVAALPAPSAVRRIVAGAPGEPTLYAIVEHWGVFRSEDGGRVWLPANRLPCDRQGRIHVDALAVAPADAHLAVATIEGAIGWPAVYKTGDGGLSWVARRGLPPLDPEALAAGPDGVVYAGSSDRIFRSSDYGDTWLEAGHRPTASRTMTMAVDGASATLYVGTEEDGLWLTADQGLSWSLALPGRTIFAIVAAGEDVYAGTDRGLYCSRDRGASWHPTGADALRGPVTALAMRTDVPGRLFAGLAEQTLLHSSDGGGTWQAASPAPQGLQVIALAPDPLSPACVYVGTSRGLWRYRLPDDMGEG
jgi:photosystem II stability/assembly factor-like uncharacterized protein